MMYLHYDVMTTVNASVVFTHDWLQTIDYNSYLSLEQPHQENDCTEENENFY